MDLLRSYPGTLAVLLGLASMSPAMTIAGSPADAPRAFVTSVTGSGDLSSWPEATPGLVGLAAGDSICANLAADAGLAGAGDYVAWLSDSSDDAYCRVAGESGKISDNCGLVELPTQTGPWVRTDLLPWSGRLTDLRGSNPLIYLPLNLDENGQPVETGLQTWTATVFGFFVGEDCGDWQSASPPPSNITLGSLDHTGANFSSWSSTNSCSGSRHLYCLKSEVFGPVDLPVPQGGQQAFVTSQVGSGDFSTWPEAEDGTSGIEAADSICNNLASDAGLALAGDFKAWVSDANTDARDRFVSGGPWNRLDGFELASDLADLTDGALFTSLGLDENGVYVGNFVVWTGTAPDGTRLPDTCDSWQSTAGEGEGGTAVGTVDDWTQLGNRSLCSFASARLYCLGDFVSDVVLDDGFETPGK